MSDLSERIRKLAAFDADKTACTLGDPTAYPHDIVSGAEHESARLLPLIEALVECQEALAGLCERGYPCPTCDLGYDDDYCTCFDEMAKTKAKVIGGREALARLERLVGGE